MADLQDTVRHAPRNNPRRKKDPTVVTDPSTLRQSGRNQNGQGKAYFSDRAPMVISGPEPQSTRARHHVDYLEGQEDIPRSDDEGGPDPHQVPPPATGDPAPSALLIQPPDASNTEANTLVGHSSDSSIGLMATSEVVQGECLDHSHITSTQERETEIPPSGSAATVVGPGEVPGNYLPPASSPQQEPFLSQLQNASLPGPIASNPSSEPDYSIMDSQVPSASIGIGGAFDLAAPNLVVPDLSQTTPSDNPTQATPGGNTLCIRHEGLSNFRASPYPSSTPPGVLTRDLIRPRPQLRGSECAGPTTRQSHENTIDWYRRNPTRIYKSRDRVLATNTGAIQAGATRADNNKTLQGDFCLTEQYMLYGIEHLLSYDIICVEPFLLNTRSIVTRGAAHAESVLAVKLDGEPSLGLERFVRGKASRKRNSFITAVTAIIHQHYGLQSSPGYDNIDQYHHIASLLDHDSFIELPNPQAGKLPAFRHPAIMAVLLALFFDNKPKLGLIFIDRLCLKDESVPWHAERADRTAGALQGMPLEAIAFACILILHVLNVQKAKTLGEQPPSFEGLSYTTDWGRFRRRLIGFGQLGQVRQELLNGIKDRYMLENPYDPTCPDTAGATRVW